MLKPHFQIRNSTAERLNTLESAYNRWESHTWPWPKAQHVLAAMLSIWLAKQLNTPLSCRGSGDTEKQSFTHSSNKCLLSPSPSSLLVPGSANEKQDVENQAASLGAEASGKPAVHLYRILKLPPNLRGFIQSAKALKEEAWEILVTYKAWQQ